MMGQAVGPVFGGLIAEYLGWHAIFWFLFILAVTALLLIVVFLPGTLESIAGNGSVRLSGIHRPLFYLESEEDTKAELDPQQKPKLTFKSVISPLRSLFENDVFITLFLGSIVYTVWSMVTSSTTALFTERYHLNTLQLGLDFLSNGFGCVTGSYLTSYLTDNDYRKTETEHKTSKNISQDINLHKDEFVDFPIEKSRLRNIWWIVTIFVATTAAYGFSLNINNIALP